MSPLRAATVTTETTRAARSRGGGLLARPRHTANTTTTMAIAPAARTRRRRGRRCGPGGSPSSATGSVATVAGTAGVSRLIDDCAPTYAPLESYVGVFREKGPRRRFTSFLQGGGARRAAFGLEA